MALKESGSGVALVALAASKPMAFEMASMGTSGVSLELKKSNFMSAFYKLKVKNSLVSKLFLFSISVVFVSASFFQKVFFLKGGGSGDEIFDLPF